MRYPNHRAERYFIEVVGTIEDRLSSNKGSWTPEFAGCEEGLSEFLMCNTRARNKIKEEQLSVGIIALLFMLYGMF